MLLINSQNKPHKLSETHNTFPRVTNVVGRELHCILLSDHTLSSGKLNITGGFKGCSQFFADTEILLLEFLVNFLARSSLIVLFILQLELSSEPLFAEGTGETCRCRKSRKHFIMITNE